MAKFWCWLFGHKIITLEQRYNGGGLMCTRCGIMLPTQILFHYPSVVPPKQHKHH
jgi:hypothetical protein